jgi:hypothetical protein
MLRQRVYGFLSYEDLNDHDPLRHGIAKTQLPDDQKTNSPSLMKYPG